MPNSTRPGKKHYRERTATISQSEDDCVLMVDPDSETRLACVQAAVDEGCRPIAAKPETAVTIAAENRPLVLVVPNGVTLPGMDLTDLVVSVGAQLIRVEPYERPEKLAERVRMAIIAARRIRPEG